MIRFTRMAGVIGAALLFIAPCTLSAQLAVGSGWQMFFWEGTGSVDAPFDSFTMTEATPFTITLTDAFVGGDEFKLSWTGSSSGSFFTSDASAIDGLHLTDDPDAAMLAGYSHGSWTFGPGSYTFALETSTLAFETTTGGAFVRADAATATVPEPATMTLLATGMAGLVGAGRRRRKS